MALDCLVGWNGTLAGTSFMYAYSLLCLYIVSWVSGCRMDVVESRAACRLRITYTNPSRNTTNDTNTAKDMMITIQVSVIQINCVTWGHIHKGFGDTSVCRVLQISNTS